MTSAIPAGILAYLLFTWSIRTGRLTKTGTHKSLQAELKGLKTSLKEDKAAKSKNPIHNKWMQFGGGFYGIMALWTFMVIELAEVIDFIRSFEIYETINQQIVIDLAIAFIKNSLMNFLTAITWFLHWLDEVPDNMRLVWFALAYGGYWAGLQLARRKGHAEKAVEG